MILDKIEALLDKYFEEKPMALMEKFSNSPQGKRFMHFVGPRIDKIEELWKGLNEWEKSPVYRAAVTPRNRRLISKFRTEDYGAWKHKVFLYIGSGGNIGFRSGESFACSTFSRRAKDALVSTLVRALESSDGDARKNAVDALGCASLNNIDISAAVSALERIAGDGQGDAELMEKAASLLKHIPRKKWELIAAFEKNGKHALPLLIGALGSEDGQARGASAELIVKIARKHPECDLRPAIPGLIAGLERSDRDMHSHFVDALTMACEPAIPLLLGALTNEDACVRREAAGILRRTEPRDYRDLDAVRRAATELRAWDCWKADKKGLKNGLFSLSELYLDWSGNLEGRAKKIVSGKRFHVPKIGKPDGTERVLRVRRVGSHG